VQDLPQLAQYLNQMYQKIESSTGGF
jgi:hypothetical protein